MFRTLDETILVAGQIQPEDVATAAAQGVRTIINNRPDDEQAGQPRGAEIEAAAKAAGLGYAHIPVDHSGFSHEQVDAMTAALARARPGARLLPLGDALDLSVGAGARRRGRRAGRDRRQGGQRRLRRLRRCCR